VTHHRIGALLVLGGGALALALRVGLLGVVYVGILVALGIEPVDRDVFRVAVGRVRRRRSPAVAAD